MIRALLIALLFVPAGAQQPRDPHAGQPKECRNYRSGKKHPNCECKRKCAEDGTTSEDPKCRVFCRKSHCHCAHKCGDS